MLIFALVAAGIGLALTALSLFLPPDPGSVAGAEPTASVSPDPEAQVPSSSPPPAGAPVPRAAVLRLVGMPLLASGLVGATLFGLDRPFFTSLGVCLSLGLPAGLAGALIWSRMLSPRK